MSESLVNGNNSLEAAWLNREAQEAFAGATVLLVEDDNDIRELMTTLLGLAGFETTACSSAEAALEQLREQPFDMVLTDYMLPNRTGGWLLKQASEEGLLDATPVMVVTAHPNPPDVTGFEVILKPFDLEDLVSRVRQRLEGSTRRPKLPISSFAPAPAGNGTDGDGQGDGCPDPVELILYVSAHSVGSAQAVDNIRRVLSRFSSDRIKLTICDLSKDPHDGEADSIAFTPTLVKRSPGPRTFILGHISNPELVTALLEACGEEQV